MIVDRYLLASAALSALFGAGAAGVFYTAARVRAVKASSEPAREIVIAADVIPIGAALTRDRLKLARMPQSLIPKGAFSKVEEVEGRAAISPILNGEPVVDARLTASHGGVGIAPLIPSGLRAVAVRVNDVVAVAGFVLPGTHVDVLVTARIPGQPDLATTTALQDLTVLSVGQTIQADAKNHAMTAQVVTLLATPGQAEILSLASGEARIQLVLRNADDRRQVRTAGRRLGELYGPGAPPRPPARPANPSRPAAPARTAPHPEPPAAAAAAPIDDTPRVLVIRGSKKTLEPAQPDKGE